eukprot:jgi/Botrbrau1/2656/Bobra.0203s0007.1
MWLPNQTLYVNNLYEKLKKDDLKKALYAVFSQFGRIIDIVALKTYRLRGQAWVVFDNVNSATNALRSMQGFPFFEKPMRLAYAKTESDSVAKLKGTYSEKDKKERKSKNVLAREKLLNKSKEKARGAAPVAQIRAAAPQEEAAPPNKILFVQNLPEAATKQMLGMLFQQFAGFTEVRMVEQRPGIAFVEFENDMQASVAMSGLEGFKVTPEKAMSISYAKQ